MDQTFRAFVAHGVQEKGEVVQVLMQAVVVCIHAVVHISSREGDERIPHLLGAHAAQNRSGESVGFPQSHFLRAGHALVGVGVEEHTQVGLQAVFFSTMSWVR